MIGVCIKEKIIIINEKYFKKYIYIIKFLLINHKKLNN